MLSSFLPLFGVLSYFFQTVLSIYFNNSSNCPNLVKKCINDAMDGYSSCTCTACKRVWTGGVRPLPTSRPSPPPFPPLASLLPSRSGAQNFPLSPSLPFYPIFLPSPSSRPSPSSHPYLPLPLTLSALSYIRYLQPSFVRSLRKTKKGIRTSGPRISSLEVFRIAQPVPLSVTPPKRSRGMGHLTITVSRLG